ncbi:hypothetical protein L2719_16045 [Shewanella schlegeliana]|uniref:MSHA biogenesis protein MshC n=1 Tax=Shewanella schlegeliana TaxID=190308 RepID=A0ABS1T2R0_9GAMM|nr:hypothetical protein [Shewanella schlegeliana]MBL4915089.1 hypothetical protein [Shewanella schlegeliana]MCL1111045.1 hypothetical protein [Shewanella schlegeliana]GIU29069.1 hypothetical protein TUM4433_17890 [Shewanella schlegeliana]
MSSPLGGLYISSFNRCQQTKFDLSRRVRIQLDVTLAFIDKVCDNEVIVAKSRSFYVGEAQTFVANSYSIEVESGFFSSDEVATCGSSLLNLKCRVNGEFNGNKFNGQQEVNLSPNEPVSSLVNGSEQLKITLVAKPV